MNGELVVLDDLPRAFTEHVATAFSSRANDDFSFVLSGGSTARSCYECLAEDDDSQIDWWKVDFYWGDERCVPLDSEDSNYRLAREALARSCRRRERDVPHALRGGSGPVPVAHR